MGGVLDSHLTWLSISDSLRYSQQHDRKEKKKERKEVGSCGFGGTSWGCDALPGQMSNHLFLERRTPAALEIGRRRPTQHLLLFSSFFV